MTSEKRAKRLMNLQQRVHGKHATMQHLRDLDEKKAHAFEVLLKAGINPMNGSRRPLRNFDKSKKA